MDIKGGKGGEGTRSDAPPRWWRAHRRALVIALVTILVLLTTSGAVDAFSRYSHDRALASDGMHHLRAGQALLPSGQALTAVLDPAVLSKMSNELAAAEHDFSALRADLNAPGGTLFLAAHAPGLSGSVSSAALLAAAADEACLAGLTMAHAAEPIQAFIRGGVFAKSTTNTHDPPPAPLTATTLSDMRASWATARVHLNSAISFASHADLTALPSSLVSGKEVSALRGLLANWPSMQTQLDQVDGWLAVAPTLLGVQTPERLLLLLQDRSELRATGGFMGNHALVTLQGGRVQPFHLEDTYLLDRPYTAQFGSLALPSEYAWWPFSPFALRDTNLSADFPTSARLAQQAYHQESGQAVTGVIAITPVLVATLLKVTGKVTVPGYPDVVTSSNLESTIHKYQLGVLSHDDTTRKAFTAALGQAVMGRVQKLSLSQQARLVTEALALLRTKDIQVWLADPKAEALLAAASLDGGIAHGQGDMVLAVDSNIGASKANQFVTVNYADKVTIDAKGSATHHLTITYDFHATNRAELYGPDQYHSYLRVYVPPHSMLTSTSGFNFAYYSPNSFGPSDMRGHQMWAGHVLVQDGQPYTLTLVWTVLNAAQRDGAGKWHYTLDFQHQAGSQQLLTLSVTAPDRKTPAITYKGALNMDKTFSFLS